MLGINGGNQENGDEPRSDMEGRGRAALAPSLQLPKNRSTGNLAIHGDSSERARIRFSFDAGAAAADYDAVTRGAIMTDHDHGLGLSGLRRIRQQHMPHRAPTLPSPSSRTPSLSALTRSSSLVTMLDAHSHQTPLSPGPGSPNFTEDLSRFPSESLHSFSFAHQTEDMVHNRQNVLKRSIEFMKDRMGWSAASNAGIASAQARVTGDVEMQTMLDLLAKAQLVGAGNLPYGDPEILTGPLTGPAATSGGNVFENDFMPRAASPDVIDGAPLSPSATRTAQEQGSRNPPRDAGPQPAQNVPSGEGTESENSSRTSTNESAMTANTSPLPSQRPSVLKRTFTDTDNSALQQKLMDAMSRPFQLGDSGYQEHVTSPTHSQSFSTAANQPPSLSSSVHGHSTRWVPAAQAIFTTESKPPWTILAANDLACLLFGVTKAEVRKMGILEVVQDERRSWLERKLQKGFPESAGDGSEGEIVQPKPVSPPPPTSSLLSARSGGITAKLLSKPNSRSQTPKIASRRPATVHSGDPRPPKPGHSHHKTSQSRGVLLCGDVVPIQKRNGATGSASLWVKEKKVGLIWVLEEIHEDVALVGLDEDGVVTKLSGALGPIWGDDHLRPGMDVGKLIPRIPRQGIDPRFGEIDYAQVARRKYFTCRNCDRINIPATVEQVRGATDLRVSSFPHIAGIVVVDTKTLKIKSSNSVFCGALFGHERPDGMSISGLVPNFDKILRILTEEDGIRLEDGIVIPEHSFRKASAFLALKEGRPDAATSFLRPEGLQARHRDGSELKIDIQMRVVKSEKQTVVPEETVVETSEEDDPASSESEGRFVVPRSEMVYALWITYSRHLHATRMNLGASSPLLSGTGTPLHQPSPGQTPAHTPSEVHSDSDESQREESATSQLTRQLKEVAMTAAAKLTGSSRKGSDTQREQDAGDKAVDPSHKKTISDFAILEEMGQGAYGQVKLARDRTTGEKCVLKYVTKRRILVDTWTRDRRLGTVPLEIHVLDYLRRDGFKHPNIVEMEDFFEDDVNYYIEMVPHGLPGMDLFDYIELRTTMDEQESRSIFVQVARAIQHLHTKAFVVHRDIKDENVILDGEGRIKLIDFGSAAYIKSGPFDVFVGTIDYAAPEVLAGKPYGGKEQDVWALGILLYTIIYKENPFYSIDEIMDRDLRVPYIISDDSIDLIRCMLDRDLDKRYDIEQVLAHPWSQME
ncbi:hypothetical protein B0T22DRAFT_475295 [Podospora appendiculata]|uniref:non-specific serine/threonine protein kinase n=1 Tax=Podospora appendiculata TaxID=314037 RepID=A0AAE1CFG6_9PEZI|nr:hypothetical protein B0T22DRAFT_475295 [Podospora appendiculata]